MAGKPSPESLRAAARLQELLYGAMLTPAISMVAELGIADLLASGSKAPAELAEATGAQEVALYRVLRAVASVGIFAETSDGRFGLTPMAELLRSDAAVSQRYRAMVTNAAWQRAAWSELRYSIATGKPAFERVFGKGLFGYLREDPDAAAVFNQMLSSAAGQFCAAVLDAHDFSEIDTLVDVGAGHGALIAAVLAAYPGIEGILFDLPQVAADARANLEAAGVAGRCRAVGGDFFDSVPPGADAYLLANVLHDWDDDRAAAILSACRAAMDDEGHLIVIEWMIPAGNEPHPGKVLDLQMLVVLGGRERTQPQFEELFERAGFELSDVVETRARNSILVGRPR